MAALTRRSQVAIVVGAATLALGEDVVVLGLAELKRAPPLKNGHETLEENLMLEVACEPCVKSVVELVEEGVLVLVSKALDAVPGEGRHEERVPCVQLTYDRRRLVVQTRSEQSRLPIPREMGTVTFRARGKVL